MQTDAKAARLPTDLSAFATKPFILEKVGFLATGRRAKREDSLLQNKDNKTWLLQHVLRINGLSRFDPA